MTSKKLPVFIFPEELKIPKTSRKQVLTLYNPYDVSLSFRSKKLTVYNPVFLHDYILVYNTCIFLSLVVLSTAPHLYRVVESEGVMKPHCCVDM